jgi:hypothetical protein
MHVKIDVYKILVGKQERNRPFGRSRHRWQNNITMDLREIGWEGVDWMHLPRDRYGRWGGGFCEHGNEPWGSIKGW